ncbi:TonB-dependent receptor [Rheinheimera aquimaris]|jgi:hypothetical protein|nr:TonB-dependent receptor [Rheinheimera aquimaris]MCD1598508.1 TonB-dependent receptor [Rheinheimera aquimaris]
MKIKSLALAITLAVGASNVALAQETSSAIRGNVVTASGQVAANATVDILHVPSGTRSTATTNDSGAFSSSGLRVGGPYTITITGASGAKTYQNIFISLGETLRLNAQLEQVERIAVTGARIIGSNNSGSSSFFGEDDISNAPTFNRDLKEVARMNPYANILPGSNAELSIAGSNPKYNSTTIDGVGVNDDFGLNSNGYPTQRSPISIDAIEQISVDVAPFDAAEGNFSGGRINAVTKSGTNEFHGSLTYEKMSDSWAGKSKNPKTGVETDLDFERDTYSLTLGGPLIKDTLFFFGSYEKTTEPAQVTAGPAGSGAINEAKITEAELERVRSIARTRYGIEDIGSWGSSPEIEDESILVKIDWNINSDHRAAFTYNSSEGSSVRNQTTGSNGVLNLDTHWYTYTQKMDLYRATLFSDWTPDLSSEAYVNLKSVDSISGNKTEEYGEIAIRSLLNFGPDEARHANALSTEELKFGLKFNYLVGDHNLKFGGEYSSLDVYNAFVRRALGVWNFNSIDDFEAGKANQFTYDNAYTNNARDAAAEFTMGSANLYVQDQWYFSDDIEIGMGLRYERLFVSDKPALNDIFVGRYGFSNQENLDGLSILMPRVNIKWTATDDLTLNAGFGRFSGGKPNVYISNSFSNDGTTLVSYDKSVAGTSHLTDVTSLTVPQNVKDAMFPGDGFTNFIDPNYKIPSDWIARVSADYLFSVPNVVEDVNFSAEVMKKWMVDNNRWVDISRCKKGETSLGVNIYEPCDPTAKENHYDLMLTNEDSSGDALVFTTSLNKNWDNGFSAYASYTYQDINEGTPGTSSTADSNYQYNVVVDRNQTLIGRADYEIEHSLKIVLGYSHEFFAGYDSKFNLFFQRRSGTHFSRTFGLYQDGDFGDNSKFYGSSAYLVYVPTGADDPNISPEGIQYEEIMSYMNQVGLGKYAGGFAPKGVGETPWITSLDFQFQQETPGFVEGHKGVFYFTISNLLNLIDSSKGSVRRMQFTTNSIVDFGGLDSEGRYIYEKPFSTPTYSNWDQYEPEQSTWRIKLGVSYKF